jgi:hypothetical protein
MIGLPFAADWARPSHVIEGPYAFVPEGNGTGHEFGSYSCVLGRGRDVSDGIAEYFWKDVAKVVFPEAAALARILSRVPLRATSAKLTPDSRIVSAADRSQPHHYGGGSVFTQYCHLRS